MIGAFCHKAKQVSSSSFVLHKIVGSPFGLLKLYDKTVGLLDTTFCQTVKSTYEVGRCANMLTY